VGHLSSAKKGSQNLRGRKHDPNHPRCGLTSPFSADALVPLLAAADASWHAALGLALETAATVYEMQLDETAVVRDASIQAGREAVWRVAAASRAIAATARAAAEYVVSTAG